MYQFTPIEAFSYLLDGYHSHRLAALIGGGADALQTAEYAIAASRNPNPTTQDQLAAHKALVGVYDGFTSDDLMRREGVSTLETAEALVNVIGARSEYLVFDTGN